MMHVYIILTTRYMQKNHHKVYASNLLQGTYSIFTTRRVYYLYYKVHASFLPQGICIIFITRQMLFIYEEDYSSLNYKAYVNTQFRHTHIHNTEHFRSFGVMTPFRLLCKLHSVMQCKSIVSPFFWSFLLWCGSN